MQQTEIQQVTNLEKQPGSCRTCGSARKGIYLDTGHLEEFYGSVYYCWECFHEMATKMGYVKPDFIEAQELEIQNLRDEIFSYKQLVEGYGRVFDGLDSINSNPIFNPPEHPVLVSNEQVDEGPSIPKIDLGTGKNTVIRSLHD